MAKGSLPPKPFGAGQPVPTGTRFAPGKSGNPGGRPSLAKAWEAATNGKTMAGVTAEALAIVYEVAMKGPKGPKDTNWTFAIQQVLHYSAGKPKEHVEVSGDVTPEALAFLGALRMTPHERRQATEDDAAMEAATSDDDGD